MDRLHVGPRPLLRPPAAARAWAVSWWASFGAAAMSDVWRAAFLWWVPDPAVAELVGIAGTRGATWWDNGDAMPSSDFSRVMLMWMAWCIVHNCVTRGDAGHTRATKCLVKAEARMSQPGKAESPILRVGVCLSVRGALTSRSALHSMCVYSAVL